MSKIYPVTDRIILIPDPIDESKKDGLIIPDDSKEKPNYATVYSVGPNCKQTKEGDRVIYPHKYGTNLKFEEQGMIIMKESDLWALIGESEQIYSKKVVEDFIWRFGRKIEQAIEGRYANNFQEEYQCFLKENLK